MKKLAKITRYSFSLNFIFLNIILLINLSISDRYKFFSLDYEKFLTSIE